MLSLFRKYWGLQAPSLLLLLLPYTISKYNEFEQYEFFSMLEFIALWVCILVIHILLVKLYFSNENKYKNSSIVIYTSIAALFYVADISNYLVELEFNYFGAPLIKLRWLTLLVFIGFSATLFFAFKKLTWAIRFQNAFLLILALLGLARTLTVERKIQDPIIYQNNYFNIPPSTTANKPVILIILDAYSSPIELLKQTKDSSLFKFGNELRANKWQVKNEIPSFHDMTDLSISSLMNFNLSKKQDYSSASYSPIPFKNLIYSDLIDSLNEKGVTTINNGIFHVGAQKPLTRVYFYPVNILEIFLSRTVCSNLIPYLSNIELDKVSLGYYPSHTHNEKVFKELNSSRISGKTFVYAHFYMPHKPYYYGSEFPFREVNLYNYIEYWKFANNKINENLKRLTKKDVRIILTSDHGYRSGSNVNPLNCFAAFYGFEKSELEDIKSVQDIGILINAQFTN